MAMIEKTYEYVINSMRFHQYLDVTARDEKSLWGLEKACRHFATYNRLDEEYLRSNLKKQKDVGSELQMKIRTLHRKSETPH
jgi:hypothetical protein